MPLVATVDMDVVEKEGEVTGTERTEGMAAGLLRQIKWIVSVWKEITCGFATCRS